MFWGPRTEVPKFTFCIWKNEKLPLVRLPFFCVLPFLFSFPNESTLLRERVGGMVEIWEQSLQQISCGSDKQPNKGKTFPPLSEHTEAPLSENSCMCDFSWSRRWGESVVSACLPDVFPACIFTVLGSSSSKWWDHEQVNDAPIPVWPVIWDHYQVNVYLCPIRGPSGWIPDDPRDCVSARDLSIKYPS